jgi:hypothetical protein
MNLGKRALGLSLGLVWGFTVLITTWWLLAMGSSGITISTFSRFYFGYSFSWGGGLIGFLWGFIYGFIAGVIIAWLYNLFNKKFSKTTAAL